MDDGDNHTKVAVVIPAYNAEDFILLAVTSAFGQQSLKPNVIVVNDCSTDRTSELARVTGAEVIDLPKNGGAANALNVGIQHADTEYVCWLSADDVFVNPEKNRLQAEAMDRSGSDLSYCAGALQGPSLDESEERVKALDCLMDSHPLFSVIANNPINGSSVMMRKSSFARFGYFRTERANFDADGEMWMRWISRGAKVERVPILGTFYKHHPAQHSKKRLKWYYAMALTRLRFLFLENPSHWLDRDNRL